jgi:hypothetical protein
MGPVTRTLRIIFSAIFGAIAGFIVCIFGGDWLWHTLWPLGLVYLRDPIAVAVVALGTVIGIVLGARQRKREYHDEY